MNILVGAGDVHVAAENKVQSAGPALRGIAFHGLEKTQLGGKILSAVRHVYGTDDEIADAGGHDPCFEVEIGVLESGAHRKTRSRRICRPTPE